MIPKIGGQAVLEGVMLKSEKSMAVAVRDMAGKIVIKTKNLVPNSKRLFLYRTPFLRGFLQLFSLLILGMEALKFSVTVLEGGETKKRDTLLFAFSAFVAITFTIIFFFLLPFYVTHFSKKYLIFLDNSLWFNLYEGIIRIIFFLGYLLVISLMKDIKRVFQYHGAEHKVISAYENGDELIPERVIKYSRFHPRCGTSFLILVILVSVIFFSLFKTENIYGKILLRLIAFPVISGFIYELLKLEKISLFKVLFIPGLWLQKLTTREPDLEQIEVAIQAFKALDHKEV
ncbi:MAG: DUF1385 domain-containing protein [Proteobacteria bacterium]|nr:DUF1385 domain-containing protein [Pseudomonadota bacterium]